MKRERLLDRYLAAVSLGGAVLLVVMALAAWSAPHDRRVAEWLLVALVVAAEMAPLRVPYHDDTQEVTLSTSFVFALLLLGMAPTAVLAQAGASALADAVHRKPWFKTLFNASQYAISVTAAGLMVHLLGQVPFGTRPELTPQLLFLVMPVAGATLFFVNSALVGSAIAMAQRVPLGMLMRGDMLFQGAASAVLLSQAPLLVVLVEQSTWHMLMFLPAVLFAYRSSRVSLQRAHDAHHDALTGLPNRRRFSALLARALDWDPDAPKLVLLVRLRDFREVNDTLGRAVGDRVVVEAARRLREDLDDVEVVARLGDDELALFTGVPSRGAAHALVSRVRASFSSTFDLDGLPFHVEISIGGAFHPEHGSAAETLIQRADIALDAAERRHSGFEIYCTEIDRFDPRRLKLLGEISRAVGRGDLTIHLQPEARLATGEIVGAEALVRWQHPEIGLVPPDEFVPLAEATGVINELSLDVAVQAIEQCRVWRARGYDLRVAVNLSPRSLHDESLPSKLGSLLARAGVPPAAFEVEITESGAMEDLALAQRVLGRLRETGIRIALDDFGTGHSSLAHLKRLPVDAVKIDKSFVFDLLLQEEHVAIVGAMVHLAHSLGLEVVAEGVESDAAWRALARAGCDLGQGYHLAPPLVPEDFLALLTSGARTVRRIGRPTSTSALARRGSR